jgi:3-deoxy-D-manno-octulosonic-acid transferase
MRFLYSLLFYLGLPAIFLRLLWRARKNPAYAKRISERLGHIPEGIPANVIWWHAVSVGETLASVPLIKALLKQYPDIPLLVTTMTPNGSLQVQQKLGNTVYHMYLPYDLPHVISAFIQKIKPRLFVMMETELWPNTLFYCKKYGVPSLVANARLSEKSAKNYARFSALTKEMLNNISTIAVQNSDDAARFVQLGFPKERMVITSSVKFDITIPPEVFEKASAFKSDRFTWIAASTHPGEEEILLDAHRQLQNTLLILVPRNPERSQEVQTLCQKASFNTCVRSKGEHPTPETQVFLIDTIGELLVFYATSTVAFVGGSLIPKGGHNLLEPAALGLPVLSGSSLYNFAEIEKLLLQAEALTITDDAQTLADTLNQLRNDPLKRETLGEKAKTVVQQNKGATEKHLALIGKMINLV